MAAFLLLAGFIRPAWSAFNVDGLTFSVLSDAGIVVHDGNTLVNQANSNANESTIDIVGEPLVLLSGTLSFATGPVILQSNDDAILDCVQITTQAIVVVGGINMTLRGYYLFHQKLVYRLKKKCSVT